MIGALSRLSRGCSAALRPRPALPAHFSCGRAMSSAPPARAAGGDSGGPSAEGLAASSCSLVGGCSPETPLVPEADIPGLLAVVPAWRRSEDGKSISRRFTAKNFVAAVDFLNRIVPVAEAEGHHPDVHITNWRDVEVVLTTHAIGGLAMADFVMAAKLDTLPVEYSPKWLKQAQAAGGDIPGAPRAGTGSAAAPS